MVEQGGLSWKSSAGKVELEKFSWEGWPGKCLAGKCLGKVQLGNLVGRVELGNVWGSHEKSPPVPTERRNRAKEPQWFPSPMTSKNHDFSGSIKESSGKPEP